MLPTLAEVLTLFPFKGAEVRTGHAQLGQPVAWVHVSEISDAARFLSGGELLLSTGTPLAGADPAAYVRSLAASGAHGLALELLREVREVPRAALEAAYECNFPLIVFQQEVNFAELTRAAHARILRPPAADALPSLSPVTQALNETGRTAAFVAAQLGAVLALPLRPRQTLLETLGALLACNFNVAESARSLGVRRQTVYYRIEQLRAMLGDLNDPRRQLGLLLALELHHAG